MSTENLPDHVLRPQLRPVQPVPVTSNQPGPSQGQQMIALRDPNMLSQQTLFVPPPVMQVLQHFQGQQTLEEIAQALNGPLDQLVELAQRLDSLGLLWGPTCEQLEKERWDELEKAGTFPIRSSQMLGEDEAACRKALDEYFEAAEDPELDGPPRAIVAPHMDYPRAWANYAAAYYPFRDTEAPDRVVILGTGHFGIGDGAVLSELGFETPMGMCPPDDPVIAKIVEKLGRPIIIDQLDHLAEHSIELQLPWIQYLWGNLPVIGVLVPDPLVAMIEDNDERVAVSKFTEVLAETLHEVGGKTLFIGSCDLSHAGPQLGEPRPIDEQRQTEIGDLGLTLAADGATGRSDDAGMVQKAHARRAARRGGVALG